MDLAIGQVYGGKYRIAKLLGTGSMGSVYEGENVRIHRKVAIKTLHQGMAEKGDTLQRFEREAQAAGRIGSQHIVEVLDMGDLPDGSRYMVMEHLEGTTLQEHIRSSGRLKPEEASPILQQLLEGLGAAHKTGIIHRDLKPANVFLVAHAGRPDFVKILDFGVSKFSVLSDEMSMTRTGAVLGTPYYMSPEQAKGSRDTDGRSDLYAVGVILYECITGQVPFSAETFNELLFRIVLESPPPAESYVPDLPPSFALIIRKAMAREPVDRYQTAGEFKQALAEWSARAAAEAEPSFDGLATLVQQTAARTVSPLAADPPAAAPAAAAPPSAVPPPPSAPPRRPAAALRPAQPSTTAGGMMVIGPGPQPATQNLAALGTVIIDPAVAVPVPLHAPAAANAVPPPAAGRSALPTAPLPQWTGAPAATPAPPGFAPSPMAFPTAAPAAVPAAAPGPNGWAPYPGGPYPAQGQAPATDAAGRPSMEAPAPQSMLQVRRSALRTVAILGIAAGLLLGAATWAVLWRGGNETPVADDTATGPTTALPGSAAPAPSTAAASDTAGGAATASSAAPGDSAGAAPIAAPTSVPEGGPASAAGPRSSGKPGAIAKPSAAAAATPSGVSTGKPPAGAGTNPSGKRTVSQDL